jgi:hypothetical protein
MPEPSPERLARAGGEDRRDEGDLAGSMPTLNAKERSASACASLLR